MSGGEESEHVEAFAVGVKRGRDAFLAGTALVAAPAFLALSLGTAQAGDLIINSGTYVNKGKLVVDDVTTGSGGRLTNKGKLTADEVTNSGRIKNKGKLEADDLTNKKGGVILNKRNPTLAAELHTTTRLINNRTHTP